MDMGTQGSGRKRLPNRERLTAEDDALNQIAREEPDRGQGCPAPLPSTCRHVPDAILDSSFLKACSSTPTVSTVPPAGWCKIRLQL
ncbi:hypothetical protein G4228_013056 [Cervus hanglu yarkandensis]|nr:hypothetical protein G4228_013056 [Cervus hanglu yarkandensis]